MKYLIVALIVFISVDCFAQSKEADSTSNNSNIIFDWLSNNGVQIRKAFDGTKSEDKAALFQYTKDFETPSNSESTLEMAVKVGEISVDGQRMYFYPVVEWHRKIVNEDLQNEDSYNKTSLSLKGEWGVFNTSFTPLLIGSSAIKKDIKDKNTEGEFDIEVTFFSIIEGLPGSSINNKKGFTVFKYYPYFGYEYYLNGFEGIDRAEFYKFRFYLEIYPFGTDDIMSILEYEKRWGMGGGTYNLDPSAFSGTISYNLTKYFSITLEYEDGELPINDFQKSKSLTLGIGLKI